MRTKGPGLRDEVSIARIHLLVGLSFVLGGVSWLAAVGVDAATVVRSLDLIVLGGITIIIFGTSRVLISGMAGRNIVGPTSLAESALALASVGSLGRFLAPAVSQILGAAFTLAWSLGMVIHVAVIAVSVRRPRLRGASADASDPTRNRLILALDWASLFFGLASALALPLAEVGTLPLLSALHFLLPGFVTLTIVGVACRVLPRLTGVPFPVWWLRGLAGILPIGPLFLGWGLIGHDALLFLGMLTEASGLLLFAGGTLVVLSRAVRRRSTFLLHGTSAVAIVVGILLGVLFVVAPATRAFGPVHGLLNVLGFVGLFVLGTSIEMYAPALRAGLRAFRMQAGVTIFLSIGGVLTAVLGSLASIPPLGRVGLVVYAVGVGLHLAGVVAVVVRSRHKGRLGLRVISGAPRPHGSRAR